MTKQNRRSKRSSVAATSSSSPGKHTVKRVEDLESGHNEQVKVMTEKMKMQAQLSSFGRQRNSSEAGSEVKDEIHKLKAQKVQLLCKMKLQSVQFRLSKAFLEKEVLHLKKEQRRNEYEMRKLLALNERQKLVLKRKTEEASMAAKRLNELLESKKANRNSGSKCSNNPGTQGIEAELKLATRVEEIRADYERQMEEMADEVRKYEEEAEMLREENFRLLLQEKEGDCALKDSELSELKEELAKLNILVSQLRLPKAQNTHLKESKVNMVLASLSTGSSAGSFVTCESGCSGDFAAKGKPSPRQCCSCSKRSLCKTPKCECRAAGGACGTLCGCATARCTNREVPAYQFVSSHQLKAEHCSSTSKPESLTSQLSSESNNQGPTRKPLSDVGNTLNKASPPKPGLKKKKGQKTVFQPNDAEAPIPVSENCEAMEMADKGVVADIPVKLRRAKRSASIKNTIPS